MFDKDGKKLIFIFTGTKIIFTGGKINNYGSFF